MRERESEREGEREREGKRSSRRGRGKLNRLNMEFKQMEWRRTWI